MQVFSVHKTKLHIFQEKLYGQNLPWHAQPPFVQEQPHPVDCAVQPIITSREHPLSLCTGARHTGTSWSPCQRQGSLLVGSPPVQRVLVSFQGKIWRWFGYVWRIEKEKSERKRSGNFTLKCLLSLMSKWFRFGLFQQLRVPSEYWALPSELPI